MTNTGIDGTVDSNCLSNSCSFDPHGKSIDSPKRLAKLGINDGVFVNEVDWTLAANLSINDSEDPFMLQDT